MAHHSLQSKATVHRSRRVRLLCSIAVGAVASVGAAHAARAERTSPLSPDAFYVQGGGANGTQSLAVGLLWDWDMRWGLGPGELRPYVELTLSQWRYDATAPGKGPPDAAGDHASPAVACQRRDLPMVHRSWRWSQPHFLALSQRRQAVLHQFQLWQSPGRRPQLRYEAGIRVGAARGTLLQRGHQAPEPWRELRAASLHLPLRVKDIPSPELSLRMQAS